MHFMVPTFLRSSLYNRPYNVCDQIEGYVGGWKISTDENLKCLVTVHPDLSNLDLSKYNQLTDEGLEHLCSLKKLKILNLSGTNITSLDLVAKLENLEELNLSYCYKITRSAPLGKLTHLKHLDLSGCVNIEDRELLRNILDGCNILFPTYM